MMDTLKKLASLRLTLAAMASLATVAIATAGEHGVDTAYTAIPIAVLVLNLLAALLTNRSLRTQTGLLVFHVGLLLVFVLAGLTVSTRFDGHVEVVQGGAFEPGRVAVTENGWLHRNRLDQIRFSQGDIRVDYLPGLRRQGTRSTIFVPRGDGREDVLTVGDGTVATLSGYRVAATFNKGFAVIVRWRDASGNAAYGAVHFPSYPEHDWNQRIDWTTPAGQRLMLELELEDPPQRVGDAWTIARSNLPFALHVDGSGEQPITLAAGDSTAVNNGEIEIVDLRLWMGYRIDYLPFLPWMLVAALLAIGGLAAHYRNHYRRQHRFVTTRPRVAEGVPDVAAA